MAKLRVGVLEIIGNSVSPSRIRRLYEAQFRKHYASIAPQAVAVWCRELGHDVHYATYYGQKDPKSLLPHSLDIVFLATDTQSSALAYALAKLYRKEKTRTVIGGPHATSFPTDCLRFFDLVVHDCDRTLIGDILRGSFDRPTIVTSGRAFTELPSVEERLPEIITASFNKRRRPTWMSSVPLLSSVGCPYRCDFCIDWNHPYLSLPRERLEADLRYVSQHLPGVLVSYHDPNFGIRIDQILDIIETLPEKARNRYVMESSLSVLRGPRLPRLRETNCIFAAPGVESWGAYSNKSGVGLKVGEEKLARLVDHFRELHEYVSGLQANFVFGTDLDEGDEPVELTMEFIRRLPFVWPTINIPVPFGGTPLYENYLDEDRILRAMPFSFYYMPYLVTKLKNYHPLEYYGNLVKIFTLASSGKMLMRRLSSARMTGLRPLHTLRTLGMRCDLTRLRRIQGRLRDDSEFRAFHEGRSDKLPAFYRRRYAEGLGRYSELISEAEMRPVLEPPSRVVGSTPSRSGKRGISRIDRHIAVAVSSNPSAPEEGERPSAGG